MEGLIVLEIMRIALTINSEQKNTIFVEYSGHVNSLRIYICKDGWEKDHDFDYKQEVYLDDKKAEKELKEIVSYLKGLED